MSLPEIGATYRHNKETFEFEITGVNGEKVFVKIKDDLREDGEKQFFTIPIPALHRTLETGRYTKIK